MDDPWRDASEELLAHAAVHMRSDNNFDRRMAFVSIDWAVQEAILTFLRLPERVSGIRPPKPSDLEAASRSFPNLLKMLLNLVGDRLSEIPVKKIEFYRQIRNTIHYSGALGCVEYKYVKDYYDAARLVTRALFGERRSSDDIVRERPHRERRPSIPRAANDGGLVQQYKAKEYECIVKARSLGGTGKSFLEAADYLYLHGHMDVEEREAIQQLRRAVFEGVSGNREQKYRLA